MSKTALITGITGQDGSFLAEFSLRRDMRFMTSCAANARSDEKWQLMEKIFQS